MPRIGHFEQLYDDPKAAADFYAEVFGWKIETEKVFLSKNLQRVSLR